MRHVVDVWRVRVAGVMPDAEGEVTERHAFAVADEAEDHAELAVGRREIQLEASGELGPLAVFEVAAPQGLDLNAFALKLAASVAERLGPRAAASHRVLGEGALVKEDADMTPPDRQELSLAVYRQERPVLGL